MSDPRPEDLDENNLAWTHTTEKLECSPEALGKIDQLVANPPQPSERLRAAARRHWQRSQK